MGGGDGFWAKAVATGKKIIANAKAPDAAPIRPNRVYSLLKMLNRSKVRTRMAGRVFESKQNAEKSANPHDHSSFDSKRFFSDQIERAAAATEEPLRPGEVKVPTRAHKPANDAAPINDYEPA